jgi:hypothetical protein
MKIESPGPSSPQNDDITTAGPTFNNAFLYSLYDDPCDLNSDLTLMPQYFSAESPASSLSTPTTQTSFEDFQSSQSSASSNPASLLTDKTIPYLDGFDNTQYFDDFTPFVQVKQEPTFYFDQFEYDYQYQQFEYKPEPIHQSIEMPASPLTDGFPPSFLAQPSFPGVDSFDRTVMQPAVPQLEPTPYPVNGYTSSSDETILDPPPQKKFSRNSKPDKGIKCDHCGVDKTPLWRKVPEKPNSYHWYFPQHLLISAMHADYIINRTGFSVP